MAKRYWLAIFTITILLTFGVGWLASAAAPSGSGTGDQPTNDAADDANQQVDDDDNGEKKQDGSASQKPPRYTVWQPADEAAKQKLKDAAADVSIGSDDADGNFKMRVEFTRYGAGIKRITLADYDKQIMEDEPYVVQEGAVFGPPDDRDARYPSAAAFIDIDDRRVWLRNQAWHLVKGSLKKSASEHSVAWRAQIEDNDRDGKPKIIEIVRTYTLKANSYELLCNQVIRNLDESKVEGKGRAYRVRWVQYGQVDLPTKITYMGDKREVVIGYFDQDAVAGVVYHDGTWMARSTVIDEQRKAANQKGDAFIGTPVWPNSGATGNTQLVWVGMTNRYFAAATYLPVKDGKPRPLADSFDLALETPGADEDDEDGAGRVLAVALRTKTLDLTARPDDGAEPSPEAGEIPLSVAYYFGPRKKAVLNEPPFDALALDGLLHYSLGGMCSFCTFQDLARALLWLMRGIHDVTLDWGIAIIILVLMVRLALHPLTKKSQIQISKFSKQMAQIRPELDKLKKKYENDQQRYQQEQLKLMREKGISPFSMLGCLPMFLQMPIWIALYAMLFFAIELRHESAFFGVFQLFGDWRFLADLSSSDNFIYFSDQTYKLPLCGFTIPYSVNILPILMALVFFFQQKLTMQPAMNEQQEQQQKMMKWVTLLFPVMLYGAPAGLNLYILASSLGGMLDSYLVRKQIKRMEEDGTLFQKKPPKKGGLADRLSTISQRMQKEMEKRQQPGKGGKGGGKKRRR